MKYYMNESEYTIEYEVDDLSEHIYNIGVYDEDGEEVPWDTIPTMHRDNIENLVDKDAFENSFAEAFEMEKNIRKYGA